MLNFGTEADDTHPAIKEQVKQAIKKSEQKIAVLVRKGIANNEFKSSFDAEQFALKAFAMIEGAIFISRVQNSNNNLKIVINALKKEIEEYVK